MISPDGRTVYVNHCRGREDVDRLVELIMSSHLASQLFNIDGRLYALTHGKLIFVKPELLAGIIRANFCSVRVVLRDGIYSPEYTPAELQMHQGRDLMAALLLRVAEGPILPRAVPDRLREEIADRARSGEQRVDIARRRQLPIELVNDIVNADNAARSAAQGVR